MVGSTESDLIWKVKATPSKESIFRLAPSMRRTSDKDCIGWRTPNTRDGMQSGYADMEKMANRWERGKQVQLCDQVRMEHKTWPTPKASDGEGGRTTKTVGGGNSHLPIHVREATWPTPNHSDDNASRVKDPQSYSLKWLSRENSGSQLAHYAQGYYATITGTTQSGSTEPTEKRGALNPEFVCWLMGFPPEWESCAPTAMPSSRRSRQK